MKDAATLRMLAEQRASEQAANGHVDIASLTASQLDEMIHELRVHQIQLEMQNDQLRTAESEIAQSRSEFVELYELAPVGYCTVSPDGIIVQANLTLATLLGVARNELVGAPFSTFICPAFQDRFYLFAKERASDGKPLECELQMNGPDKSVVWTRVISRKVLDSDDASPLRLIISDISKRRHAEEQLQFQLQEKTALLAEVHHRLKNNFASLESLLRLQADSMQTQETVDALLDASGRVRTMREIYEKLLLPGDFQILSAKTYLEDLIYPIVESFGRVEPVTVDVNIADVLLPVDTLQHLGMLVNELLTNVMKYAFPDHRAGALRVSLREHSDTLTLTIQDNGVGLPAGFDPAQAHGFGLMLIRILTEQMKGTMTMQNDNGARTVIAWPVAGE